jgi:hypothetical protein
MASSQEIDGVLVTWGDRLFYPGNRIVKDSRQPRVGRPSLPQRAAAIRRRIEATAVRHAPQVMVKVTGGGRGMKAIAAHLRYISKNGRLDIEDEQGRSASGRDALKDIAEEWRYGGSLIEDVSPRREAFNIMLSMPRGTADGLPILRAAREFAREELAGHKYVMVLHDHQANPHVHISVRAESERGRRLNPRKADLHRWRETFAERLRGWGIDAEASRQVTRGASRNYDALWRQKAAAAGRLRTHRPSMKAGSARRMSRLQAAEAWGEIAKVLRDSPVATDGRLAEAAIAMARSALGQEVRSPVPRHPATHQVEQTKGSSERSR